MSQPTVVILRASFVLSALFVLACFARHADAQQPAPAPKAATSQTTTPASVLLPSQKDLGRWAKPMDEIQVWPSSPKGPFPVDGSKALFVQPSPTAEQSRTSACTSMQWVPSGLVYHPLYFDDVPLERYGQTSCPTLQPVLSGACFFGAVPLLPYKMWIDRPCDCIWDLGYYRPGSPTPCIRQRVAF